MFEGKTFENSSSAETRITYLGMANTMFNRESEFSDWMKLGFGSVLTNSGQMSFQVPSAKDFLQTKTIKIQNINAQYGMYPIGTQKYNFFDKTNAPDVKANFKWETYVVNREFGMSVNGNRIDLDHYAVALQTIYTLTCGQRVIPQIDKFMVSKVISYLANGTTWEGKDTCNLRLVDPSTTNFSPLTENDNVSVLGCELHLDDIKSGETLYVTPQYDLLLKNDPKVDRYINVDTESSNGINRLVRTIDGVPIKKVPQYLMKETFGAFSVGAKSLGEADNSGRTIHYMRVWNPSLIIGVTPLHDYKEFRQESQSFTWQDSIQVRYILDLFIDEKSRSTIIAGIAPLAGAGASENKNYITGFNQPTKMEISTDGSSKVTGFSKLPTYFYITKGSTPKFSSTDVNSIPSISLYLGTPNGEGRNIYSNAISTCYITSDGAAPANAVANSTTVKGSIVRLEASTHDAILVPGGATLGSFTFPYNSSVALSTVVGKSDLSDAISQEINVRCLTISDEGVTDNDTDAYDNISEPTPSAASKADQATYDAEVTSFDKFADGLTVTVAAKSDLKAPLLTQIKGYTGAKTQMDVANITIVSATPATAGTVTNATAATAVLNIPVLASSSAIGGTQTITYKYKNA